jgi:ubiquitin C-terminal hydrolase
MIARMVCFLFTRIENLELDSNCLDQESIVPEYIYDAIRSHTKMDSLKGRQEDAEEFLGYLLDGLHEELLKQQKLSGSNQVEEWNNVTNTSRKKITKTQETNQVPTEISSLFRGRMRSIVKNVTESITIEPFQTLQLEITVLMNNKDEVIEDCIRSMTKSEILEDFQTQKGNKTTKQALIETLPPILMISLKRFVYDVQQNTTLKIDDYIQFKGTLEIPNETIALDKQFKYRLFAGIVE